MPEKHITDDAAGGLKVVEETGLELLAVELFKTKPFRVSTTSLRLSDQDEQTLFVLEKMETRNLAL